MQRSALYILIFSCFAALFALCYYPVLFEGRQFGYRDAGHYYYPLYQRVQEEWNAGRVPLWEPEENAGMPLLGNPTAAVMYPGKLIYAVLPYAWGARVYIMLHTALAIATTVIMMRGWRVSWVGSGLSALAYAFGAPVLFQYCNVIFLVGAAWLPLGVHAVERWVRRGQRGGVFELAIVLAMQVLGGDPQAAYLLGLCALGYAVGTAWQRSRAGLESGDAVDTNRASGFRPLRWLPVIGVGILLYSAATLALARWLPQFRNMTKPPAPPLPGMAWIPPVVYLTWGVLGLWFLDRWRRRGWRSPLGTMWLGLACAAGLAGAISAIQLLPVLEFTQLTTRAAGGGPHDIFPFSLPIWRLAELVWPNVSGIQFEENEFWAPVIKLPGYTSKVWVPSLYMGGITLALALTAIGFRRGPSWRIWLSVIVVVSLCGSLGEFTSPIGIARQLAQMDKGGTVRSLITGLGPLDPPMTNAIRLDGYLRDGDGGIYWWMTTVLPGFRQFRFPSKLFTFTALGIAALAGLGWDQVIAGRGRRAISALAFLTIVTAILLGAILVERPSIVAGLAENRANSMFGPFHPERAVQVVVQSMVHAFVVMATGLVACAVARRRPAVAGAIVLVLATADLAVANRGLIFTVPQSLFEVKPEVARIIDEAERARPSTGPFRVHRMPIWSPAVWQNTSSPHRVSDIVEWERKTIQPKYGINHEIEYTHTMGVAELYDYEWYFGGFPRKVRNKLMAEGLGVEMGTEVIYFPRRSYDMWNTRYFVLPYHPNGWNDEMRAFASFSFQTESVFPDPAQFRGKKGAGPLRDWLENQDFQIHRNLQEFPRAWVVHTGRTMKPTTGLSRENREESIIEIVYADDPLWHDDGRSVFDPHSVVWVESDAMSELHPYLSGQAPRPTERVKVSYPDPQTAVLDVTMESKGVVVLADVYYPGWKLTIDGSPAPIYQVNRMMRGAAVPAGAHQLVYTFHSPESFVVGRAISVVGLAVLMIASIINRLRPGRPLGQPATERASRELAVGSHSRVGHPAS